MGYAVAPTQSRERFLTLNGLIESVCAKLQLTATQYDRARTAYGAVSKHLGQPDTLLSPFSPDLYPHGSLRLQTANKPFGGGEYDVDLTCQLAMPSTWGPQAVYELIYQRLHESGVYRDKLERKPRCIRINYSGDFHLDVVPAIPDSVSGSTNILVPEKGSDLRSSTGSGGWKPSGPRAFGDWYDDRCADQKTPDLVLNESKMASRTEPLPPAESVHKKPALKRTTQLFKRWRDVEYQNRPKLDTPSIVLTRLAGDYYEGNPFCSMAMSSTLAGCVTLTRSSVPPELLNPRNPAEVISEKWRDNQNAYEDFRRAVRKFRDDWENLLLMRSLPTIIDELERLFGESGPDSLVKLAAEEFLEGSVGRSRRAGRASFAVGAGATASFISKPTPTNSFFGNHG